MALDRRSIKRILGEKYKKIQRMENEDWKVFREGEVYYVVKKDNCQKKEEREKRRRGIEKTKIELERLKKEIKEGRLKDKKVIREKVVKCKNY
jgi:hypothetical protein